MAKILVIDDECDQGSVDTGRQDYDITSETWDQDYDPKAISKICKYCNQEQQIEFFSICKIVNGVEYRRHKCNNCYQDTKKKCRQKKLQ